MPMFAPVRAVRRRGRYRAWAAAAAAAVVLGSTVPAQLAHWRLG
ncbi:hypothetical protein [Streptomyces sp. NPDC053048]